jgi:ribosomal protein S18 acetylase RimI-like enzyme
MRPYSPDDREDVFQLRTAVYGETFPREDWGWKYETSPLRPARIYLAESGGMIVGLRIFVFREVKVLDDVWLSVLAVDGMVHPDFQRRGIWSALMREGLTRLRSEGVRLAFCIVGTHRHSYAGFRKLGFLDVGSIPFLAKPLRLDGFLSRYVRGRRVRSSVHLFSRTFFRTHRRGAPPRSGGLSIERIHGFDDRFDRLWEEASQRQMVSLVRDQKYLNYRYRDRPGEKYVAFAASRGRKLEGYIVVRRTLQMLGLSIGLIMDIATVGEIDVARSLVDEATRYLDEQEVDAIGCLMMKHSPYYEVLRRAGFLPVPSRFNTRDYHLVVEADPAKISRTVTGVDGNWHLTWGDSDVA